MTIAEFLCDNLCWMGTLCIALDVSSQQAGATAVISPCLLLFLLREMLHRESRLFFLSHHYRLLFLSSLPIFGFNRCEFVFSLWL